MATIAATGVDAGSSAGTPGIDTITQIGWGFGTLGPAMVMSAFNLLMLRFMTDHLGIAAAIGGLLIASSKMIAALADPLIGIVSDRTEAQASRRRPWLLLGGAALTAAFLLMFCVPTLGRTATIFYMGAVFMTYAFAYSAFNIPYMAMPTEMTLGYHERSKLMTWRVVATAVAGIVANAGGLALLQRFGGGREGHMAMALTLAPLVMISAFTAWFATRHAPYTSRQAARASFRIADQLRLVASNRPFTLIMLVKFFSLMMLGIQAVFPFFFGNVLRIENATLGLFFAISQGAMLISQPLWLYVSRRIGKRSTGIAALLITSSVSLSWLAAHSGESHALIFLRAAIAGAGAGGTLMIGQALLPDTIELDYLRSGLRREGLFASVYSMVEKLSQALGVAGVGLILGAVGYIAGAGPSVAQPASAIEGIRLLISVLPVALNLIAVGLLLFYDLSEDRLMTLRAAAANRSNV